MELSGRIPPLTIAERRALYGNPWFAALPEALQCALMRHSALLRVPAGRTISFQGTVPEVWFGVAAGAVQVLAGNDNGADVVLDLLEPGQWFGDVPLLAQRAQPYSAETWQSTTLLLMRRNALLQVRTAHPALAPALAELNWERALRIGERMFDHVEPSMRKRTLRNLRALGQRFGTRVSDGIRIELPLTQSELARFAGASRQRVNEALGQLAQDGEIRRGPGYIELADAKVGG